MTLPERVPRLGTVIAHFWQSSRWTAPADPNLSRASKKFSLIILAHSGSGISLPRSLGSETYPYLRPPLDSHLKALERKGYITREAHMARAMQLADPPVSRSSLRSIGRLDGSNPMEVLERGNQLDFAPLFEAEENFSVTASGDTLADVDVVDGDVVVLRRARVAKDGDIVLALVDGVDPVLRIYSKDAKHVRLSASGKTKPIVSNSVQILGKAVAVIRTL